MTNYWMLITGESSWTRLRQFGFWAFSARDDKRVSQIVPKDSAVVYLTKRERGRKRVSGLAALIEFTDAQCPTTEPTELDWLYPLRAPFRVIAEAHEPVPVAPLVAQLGFVRNKEKWWVHIRGLAIRPVTAADFQVLQSALKTAARP